MISRQWCGVAKRSDADLYVSHLRNETFPQLRCIPGFCSASILRRDVTLGIEFRIVTLWESLEAIRAFAGENTEDAVVPDGVKKMMVSFDAHVVHYEVVT